MAVSARYPQAPGSAGCAGPHILEAPLDASMRNVELKARDPDPARTLERALALGAEDRGEFRQRDTYFAGATGRLKLREHETGGSPMWDELIEYSHELIGYSRSRRSEERRVGKE